MPLPEMRQGLQDAGYRHARDGRCRSATCNAELEIWTTPKGKYMPFDVTRAEGKDDILISHFVNCPDAAKFRKKRPAAVSEGAA